MKREVARAGAGRRDERRRIIGRQLAGVGIEAVDHDLVDAQVGAEGELVGLIDVDRMGVGALLIAWIDALALVLMDRRRFTE